MFIKRKKEKVYNNEQKSGSEVYWRVIRYEREIMQNLRIIGRQLYICM